MIHKLTGQAMRSGRLVDEFIAYVRACANELGVKDGIVGSLDINYDEPVVTDETKTKVRSCGCQKKKACGK